MKRPTRAESWDNGVARPELADGPYHVSGRNRPWAHFLADCGQSSARLARLPGSPGPSGSRDLISQGLWRPLLCRRPGCRRPVCGGFAFPGRSTPTASCRELHSTGPPQSVAIGSPWYTRTPPVRPALPPRPVALLPVNPVPGSPIARCVPHRPGRILAVSSRA